MACLGVIKIAMATAPATLDIPKNPTMRREWISYQLRLRGLCYRELARREGVSHQSLSAAALGGGSRHLQETIAAALDLFPQAIWPELYDAEGNRLGRIRDPNRTTPRRRRNDENTAAA
ncbi:helix-turn-helix domain-containing protein [Insolitispirillum peregrinum]